MKSFSLQESTFRRSILFTVMFYAAGCSMGSGDLIVGYVQSTKTDEYDMPVELSLFDGKDEYKIQKNEKRAELMDLLDRKIAATGSISEEWGGKKQIEIESFELKD